MLSASLPDTMMWSAIATPSELSSAASWRVTSTSWCDGTGDPPG